MPRWGESAQASGAGPDGQVGPVARLGLAPGMVVQELGWDEDTDDVAARAAIENSIDADMVDGDYGNVVDAVVFGGASDDGDLVDGLVDALTDLVGGGAIWLFTPKVGRPGAIEPADIAEAAPIAGLAQTTTAARPQGLERHPSGGAEDALLTSVPPAGLVGDPRSDGRSDRGRRRSGC